MKPVGFPQLAAKGHFKLDFLFGCLHTYLQCRERWCHHLDPRIVKCRWKAAEDEILVAMQKRIGNKWAQIARVS